MNYKHAPYIFVISVVASSLLATTAALPNENMKPTTTRQSPGGSAGAMPGWGNSNASPGGQSPGAQRGGAFFVPGPFDSLVGAGGYTYSPWVPTNPVFEPPPTQRPV